MLDFKRGELQESKSDIKVVLGIDDNFAFAAIVTIFSAHRNASRAYKYHVFFFRDTLSEVNQAAIRSLAELGIELEMIEVDGAEQFDERRWLTKATFLKLLAADRLSGPLLWLDSDLLLMRGWDAFTYERFTEPLVAALQRPHEEGDTEFNAGLLFWPSSTRLPWRVVLSSLPAERHSSDQVVFNRAYADHVHLISNRYNFVWGLFVTHPPKHRPMVIHYGGMYKPWHLPEKYWAWCEQDSCVWKPYFRECRELFSAVGKLGVQDQVRKIYESNLASGRKYRHREALGRELARLATKKPLTGAFLYRALKIFKSLGRAQALHPVHARMNVYLGPSELDGNSGSSGE